MVRGDETLVTICVTVNAERALVGPKQLIPGFIYRVITMTGYALAQLLLIKGSLVRRPGTHEGETHERIFHH
jgi:hypothetical protein